MVGLGSISIPPSGIAVDYVTRHSVSMSPNCNSITRRDPSRKSQGVIVLNAEVSSDVTVIRSISRMGDCGDLWIGVFPDERLNSDGLGADDSNELTKLTSKFAEVCHLLFDAGCLSRN